MCLVVAREAPPSGRRPPPSSRASATTASSGTCSRSGARRTKDCVVSLRSLRARGSLLAPPALAAAALFRAAAVAAAPRSFYDCLRLGALRRLLVEGFPLRRRFPRRVDDGGLEDLVRDERDDVLVLRGAGAPVLHLLRLMRARTCEGQGLGGACGAFMLSPLRFTRLQGPGQCVCCEHAAAAGQRSRAEWFRWPARARHHGRAANASARALLLRERFAARSKSWHGSSWLHGRRTLNCDNTEHDYTGHQFHRRQRRLRRRRRDGRVRTKTTHFFPRTRFARGPCMGA